MMKRFFLNMALLCGATAAQAATPCDGQTIHRVETAMVVANMAARYLGVRHPEAQVFANLSLASEVQWQQLLSDLRAHGGFISFREEGGATLAAGVVVTPHGCRTFTHWKPVGPLS